MWWLPLPFRPMRTRTGVLEMSATNFEELYKHYGHNVVVAQYTEQDNEPVNVAIECNDCDEVLMDYDKESNKWVKSARNVVGHFQFQNGVVLIVVGKNIIK